ncbi:MAG: DUF5711 family protein [Clostridia bacterium]|nr:DUF5711 family protein [Clostridia bacterium]
MDENKKNEMTENEDILAAAEEQTAEPFGSAATAEEIPREPEDSREPETGSENKKPDEPEEETKDVSGIPEEDSEGDADADGGNDGKSALEESVAEDKAAESEDDDPDPEPAEEEPEPPAADDLEPGEFDLEEGLLHGEELQRNSPAASRMPVRYYIIAGAVFLAMFLIALLVIFAVKGTLAPQIGRVEAFIKRRSTASFSAHITGASVRDTGVYKNDILLLTDSALVSFSSSAKENVLQAISCDEPSIALKKKCILLFDRSGTSVSLIRGSKVVHSFSAPKSILDADTGANGRFCIAMRDEEYKCSVMVFDPSAYANSGQAQVVEGTTKAKDVNLTYWFSDGYVTDVTCDEACRYIGVSLVRADDAIVNSEFYLVDTKNSDVSSYPVLQFPGEAIAGATILRDGSFFIVTDSAAYRTIDGELEKVVDYDDDLEIEFTSLSYATPPVILLSSFGLRDSGILMIFDKNGGLKSTVKVEGRAIGLDSSKNGAAVMITDRVLTYTADGLFVGETKLNAACEHIVFKGSFIYLQSGGEMKKVPAFSRPGEG